MLKKKKEPLVAPKGFEITHENGHSFYQCSKFTFIGQKRVQCIYRCRSDSSKKNKFTHLHNFIDIRNYGNATKTNRKSEVINLKMFNLIGKSNLSIRCVCLDPFRDLLKTTYQCGQSHPFISFDDFFPKVSRETFTNSFITEANRVQYDKIKLFSIRSFALLSVDAGTVNGISYLTIILCNTTLEPIILKNNRYFKGTNIDYCLKIGEQIEHLKNMYNIVITGIVGDNQKAQKSSIDPNSPKSIQYNSLDTNIKSICFCPCQCHSIALALKDFSEANQIFNEMISDLKYS